MKQYIFKLVVTVILTLTVVYSFAQPNQMFGYLTRVPQSTYLNPSSSPDFKWYIGSPGLSAFQFNVSNNLFSLRNVFKVDSYDSVTVDFNQFVDNLRKRNYLEMQLQEEVLAFGFKAKKNYFTFSLTEKAHVLFNYPKDLLAFFVKGNGHEDNVGKTANFSNLGLDMLYYHELALGYSRELADNVRMGGRLKVLMGVANIDVKKTDLTITTAPEQDLHDLTIQSELEINSNLPGGLFDDSTETEIGSFLTSFKNFGTAIDFGAEYKMNDKITLGASILDLGFIRWGFNPSTIKYKNDTANFTFSGLEIKDVFGSGTDTSTDGNDFASNLLDSIQDIFAITTVSGKPYTTMLPTTLVATGEYRITPKDIVGATAMLQYGFNTFRPAFSVAYTRKFGKIFQTSISYAIKNRSFTNIGFGYALTLGPLQWYIMTDNLTGLLFYNKILQEEGSIMYPINTKNINVRFGCNWVFGYLGKVKDQDKGDNAVQGYITDHKKVKKESKEAKVKDKNPEKPKKEDVDIKEEEQKKKKEKEAKVKDDDRKD